MRHNIVGKSHFPLSFHVSGLPNQLRFPSHSRSRLLLHVCYYTRTRIACLFFPVHTPWTNIPVLRALEQQSRQSAQSSVLGRYVNVVISRGVQRLWTAHRNYTWQSIVISLRPFPLGTFDYATAHFSQSVSPVFPHSFQKVPSVNIQPLVRPGDPLNSTHF